MKLSSGDVRENAASLKRLSLDPELPRDVCLGFRGCSGLRHVGGVSADEMPIP
ncbi:hypothetical protein [Methylobacterium sp. WL12]|uniref:hypothetical protein n=1 Tax=Methylobacterium sp. WL12 TaxID=2603890 RepID=UPI0016505CC0|nr:hypothetical protein [Methylobacterium sp. WL12]